MPECQSHKSVQRHNRPTKVLDTRLHGRKTIDKTHVTEPRNDINTDVL